MRVLISLIVLICITWYYTEYNDIWVIQNVLSIDDYRYLRCNLPREQLYFDTKTDAHVGQSGRKSVVISDPKIINVLNSVLDKYTVNVKIPCEYRLYYTGSHGMDWHRDERVLPSDYFECVLTLFNDSDSVFEYKDRLGLTHTVKPKANTMIMLKPEGVNHRVTPLTRGNREILKFIIVPSSIT